MENDANLKADHATAPAAAADWMLNLLVQLAERGGAVGITLASNGLIVTGEMIGSRQYATELADLFRGARGSQEFNTAIADGITNALSGVPTGANVEGGDPDGSADEVSAPAQMIHLRNARYFIGNHAGVPSGTGMLWRGKIAAVSGWSLGRFGA